MKGKRLLAALLTISLGMSVFLAGCGNVKKGENSKNDNKEEAKMDKDQYLNMILGAEPKTLDPSKATDTVSSQVLGNAMEAITRLEVDKDGKDTIVPAGAESWEMSKDGTKWTFKMRDMNWSDGQKVTVDDYIYGITRTLNKETGSPYAYLLYPIKNAQAFNTGKAKAEDLGLKKVDESTLEFTLEAPCTYFLELTYFKVMEPQRKDLIEKHGDKYGTEANTFLFTGPYMITDWVHQSKVELVKNPNYWDKDAVKLEKVTMKIIKEESSRMNELYNGSIDLAGVSKPEWIEKLDKTNNFEVKKGYDGTAWYIAYNFTDPYFKNAKIRKAFTYAMDREGMSKTLFRNLAEPATAWCPPGIQIGGEEYRKKVDFNFLDELKKEGTTDPKALLIEGLKEENMDPDPTKHTFKYLESGTDARSKEFGDFMQQNFKSVLGVNVDIDYVEWPIFQERTNKLDYQMAHKGWLGDYNDPNTFFDMWISTAKMAPNGWESEKYDELIKKAGQTTDQNERVKIFEEAERLLLVDEAVIGPTVFRFKNTYVRNYIKNYMSPMWGEVELKHTYISGRE
ncbi:peptide ABC transporter substrate-binding protein [Clostridium senegalense]|uniref:peptide ABC transporter substrate-binding protein n=1 Tax=Clostridium senegalense TaxID=1465809 RepID=UPI001C12678B|nr:peptide ABC transporter substrate-binding protein [Clostridium senegalense]MBU5225770.1 peptide ABC transporter substrate-binding protein [Clostridium senegalense]